jgi:O-antigen/teichoic acid export membrane protein
VSSIFITRILGSEGRGENAIFTNSIAFAVLFFGFSINSTIVYFINSGKAKAGELLTTTLVSILGSTLLVFVSLYLLKYFNALHLALPSAVQAKPYKYIFTALYFTSVLNGVLLAFLSTYKKFEAISIYGTAIQSFPAVIYCLMFFNILPYDHLHPFKSIVLVTFLIAIASSIAIGIVFIKILPVRPSKKLVPVSLIKEFIFFSSMAYVGNIATFFNYKLDFWVIDAYQGKSQLGIYSLAAQLAQLLWLLPAAISTVLYSYVSTGNSQSTIRFTIQLKQVAFYGTLFFGIVGIFLSYYLIPVLYGSNFFPAFNIIELLFPGVVAFCIPKVLSSLFAGRGDFKISFIISIFGFVVSAIMYFTLIPAFGLTGGAIASSISYILTSILSEIWFCKKYDVSYLNLFMIDKSLLSFSRIKKMLKS